MVSQSAEWKDSTTDPYYQRRQTFRVGSELLNLKVHRAEETRNDDWLLRPVRPLLPVIYFHAVPYLMRENYVLTVQIGGGASPDSIGKVLGSEVEGFTEQDIGTAQAWVYPAQNIVLLWECYLYEIFRVGERQAALWKAFEELLLEETPAQEIYTPGWDPAFPPEEFQAMLMELGYRPVEGTRFYRKIIQG